MQTSAARPDIIWRKEIDRGMGQPVVNVDYRTQRGCNFAFGQSYATTFGERGWQAFCEEVDAYNDARPDAPIALVEMPSRRPVAVQDRESVADVPLPESILERIHLFLRLVTEPAIGTEKGEFRLDDGTITVRRDWDHSGGHITHTLRVSLKRIPDGWTLETLRPAMASLAKWLEGYVAEACGADQQVMRNMAHPLAAEIGWLVCDADDSLSQSATGGWWAGLE